MRTHSAIANVVLPHPGGQSTLALVLHVFKSMSKCDSVKVFTCKWTLAFVMNSSRRALRGSPKISPMPEADISRDKPGGPEAYRSPGEPGASCGAIFQNIFNASSWPKWFRTRPSAV